MEYINIQIKGRFTKYAELVARIGYCFYDIDEEERYYMTSILTPITDLEELKRKYIVVEGDADSLNAELEKEVSNE